MPDRRSDIVTRLEIGLADTIRFFNSLKPADLGRPVYTDGAQWTVKQVLAHFITIEKSMQWLFTDILSGGPGSPEDFDLERFNRTQPAKLDGLTRDQLIGQFRAVRGATIAIVRAMAESDLDREGRHAYHGQGTLERFIRWTEEHARIHENDIRQALKTRPA